MFISPLVEEAIDELQGFKVLPCVCGTKPNYEVFGECGYDRLRCPSCGRSLRPKDLLGIRRTRDLVDTWNLCVQFYKNEEYL